MWRSGATQVGLSLNLPACLACLPCCPGTGPDTQPLSTTLDRPPIHAGDPDRGYQQLTTEQMPIRRDQLFNQYGPNGPVPLIPGPEPAALPLSLGQLAAGPDGSVEVVNPNAIAMDLSGYQLRGAVQFTFAPGACRPACPPACPPPAACLPACLGGCVLPTLADKVSAIDLLPACLCACVTPVDMTRCS
jgi:hypothetical protein